MGRAGLRGAPVVQVGDPVQVDVGTARRGVADVALSVRVTVCLVSVGMRGAVVVQVADPIQVDVGTARRGVADVALSVRVTVCLVAVGLRGGSCRPAR